jgi:hypothetical protein
VENRQSATDESRLMGTDGKSPQIKESTTAADTSSLSSVNLVVLGPELCIDKLLSYVEFNQNKCNVDALHGTILSFYSVNDISANLKRYLLESSRPF